MNFGVSGNNPNSFKIGKYDEGALDLSDDVTLSKKATVKSKDEAVELAKNNSGAEFVVERNDPKTGLAFDVYTMTINDPGKKINKLQDAKNLELFDKPLNVIEKNTGTKNSVMGYIVAENGEVSEPIYKTQFGKSNYEKLREVIAETREAMGFEKNVPWNWLVDTVMGGAGPTDNLPPIDKKELDNMKSHIKPGDIILNGNDGSFIHGILYVGKDSKLQDQLEKDWGLSKGALKDEGLIIHSLIIDEEKEVEVNGKKEKIKPSGAGVHVDTIERFLLRHPRDVMLAVSPKDVSDKDRQSAVDAGKKLVGKGYDKSFNTYDDSEMYCTETVMKAWQNSSKPQKFNTQLHPLISYPDFILKKLPEKIAKSLQDGGMLHQEMIMTDGIATSSSMEPVWASQNADKSLFFQKQQRWADGIEGKISDSYRELLVRDVPNQAINSRNLVNKITGLSAKTRTELSGK